ncbi:TetR/AcrR family transcriptional regulator [Nocardia cyriacigeorgica]|uniref:TetR/AcrR family transcriptional regulator n=1 Tax=Nocardia cyriacigeorgica TaxID=135487 RepID=UPI001893F4E0|nr:TetR/AcrR family transcriptional regulator [Nocardia cyriacigeorgica]MBF6454863.1 TetR/AcrR family transcriptional regulator [Nocardia cyriacigeorgica]MBF6481436.1 TetR/AcrR family transcriptional regulator [Nocardia cyriacigeorgica]MBF6552758.1 TetR/AcrR family transcriptional regulator [Nocardia cyriacigeorgica]
MTTPRARARAQTMEDIKRIARTQLATEGAAALSLRAVARELGVVSSAVYRYVRSRDELLTLLVVDGYDALGDAVDAAVAASAADPAARLRAAAHAVRDWGLAEPAWYGLLFGTPVPGYAAPAEQTVAPGTRVIATLLRLVEAAHRDAALDEPAATKPISSATLGDFARIRTEFGLEIPDWLLARALVLWSALFGAVSFDVFDMYGPGTFTDRTEVFDLQLTGWLTLLGFR